MLNRDYFKIVLSAVFLFLILTSSVPVHTQVVTRESQIDEIIEYIQKFDGQAAWDRIVYLSSEEFEGRMTGTEGCDLAAEYIAREFAKIGLLPKGDDDTYFQNFKTEAVYLRSPLVLEMVGEGEEVLKRYIPRSDFRESTFGPSGAGEETAEVVYVGYGYGDDYQDIDVKGKIVLCLIGGPDSTDRLRTAIDNEAIAMLTISEAPSSRYSMRTTRMKSVYIGPKPAKTIPMLYITEGVADDLLEGSGYTYRSLKDKTDRSKESIAFALNKRVHLLVDLDFADDVPARNVLGFLPGTDPKLKDRVLIISAHYDHIGKDPDGPIFYGASDDASGVAVVLEIAKLLSESEIKPRTSILFAAWTGEELGLKGSSYYVRNPIIPLKDTYGMIQLDTVGGEESAMLDVTNEYLSRDIFSTTLEVAQLLHVIVNSIGDQRDSDHGAFLQAGIPAVMFIYSGYEWVLHTPEDTVDRIDPDKLAEVGKVVTLLAFLYGSVVGSP